MDERLRFVARRLDGEKMAVLCREFGISRKTGYKIFNRYKDCGVEGLTDRSRRPYRHARQLPFQIEKAIIQLKQEHPAGGLRRSRTAAPQALGRAVPCDQHRACDSGSAWVGQAPAPPSVQAGRDRPRARPYSPNDLWCADYKGEFMLADRRYCYALTISDFASRYLISCEALATTKAMYAFTVFERAFKGFGLPRAIRTDNGMPFASANSLFGLTRLSVWWLRLGIDLERIKPGHRLVDSSQSGSTVVADGNSRDSPIRTLRTFRTNSLPGDRAGLAALHWLVLEGYVICPAVLSGLGEHLCEVRKFTRGVPCRAYGRVTRSLEASASALLILEVLLDNPPAGGKHTTSKILILRMTLEQPPQTIRPGLLEKATQEFDFPVV
jgi:putative transposase